MSELSFFAIKLKLTRHAPSSVHYQDKKDELYLGPHVRLSGHSGMAHIESKELAEQFAEACTLKLQKRYGNETRLRVVEWRASNNKNLSARIQKDSELVRKRLAAGNLAPNKAP